MYAFEQFEHRCPEIVKFTSTERVICPKRKIIEKKKKKNTFVNQEILLMLTLFRF